MRREIRSVLAGALMAVLAGTAAVALHASQPGSAASTIATAPVTPGRLTATASATAIPLPVPPRVNFTDMAFTPDGRTGWVAGRSCAEGSPSGCGGVIYGTTDGGSTWQLSYRGAVGLDHIGVGSARFAWAWGASSPAGRRCALTKVCTTSLLVTEDGGRTWSPVYQTRADVTDVAFDGQTGLMGVSLCQTSQPSSCSGEILASADGGRTWHVADRQPRPIVAVAFGSGRAWAVASGMPDQQHTANYALASADGGRTWARTGTIALPFLPAATHGALAFSGHGTAWLTLFSGQSCAMHGCSTDGVYRSTDGGRSWASVSVPVHPPTPQPSCGPAGMAQLAVGVTGYLFAARSQNYAACGSPDSTLSVSTDGGATWSIRSGWAQFGVEAIAWSTPQHGWSLGTHALLLTRDGGRSWTQVLPPVHPAAAVDFVSATQGWGLGDASDPGAVLATSDGGQRWTVLASIPNARLTTLSFVDSRQGWVAGVVRLNGPTGVWATDDGGQTWTSLGQQPGYHPVLNFTDPRHGVLLTVTDRGGTILTTADGGHTWVAGREPTVPSPLVSGVAFVGSGAGWALIPGTAHALARLLRTEGGASGWRTADLVPGHYLMGLSFANADVGWIFSTTDTLVPIPGENADLPVPVGTVFRTSDAGRTWQGIHLPVATGRPTDVFGLGRRTAWLLAGGLASDATLWRSTDGGRSWRQLAW